MRKDLIRLTVIIHERGFLQEVLASLFPKT